MNVEEEIFNLDQDEDANPEGSELREIAGDEESSSCDAGTVSKLIQMYIDGKLFVLLPDQRGKCLSCRSEIKVHTASSLTQHLVIYFQFESSKN